MFNSQQDQARDTDLSSLYLTGEIVGLIMILLGVVVLSLATLKYHHQERQIPASEGTEPGSSNIEYFLTAAIVALVCLYAPISLESFSRTLPI